MCENWTDCIACKKNKLLNSPCQLLSVLFWVLGCNNLLIKKNASDFCSELAFYPVSLVWISILHFLFIRDKNQLMSVSLCLTLIKNNDALQFVAPLKENQQTHFQVYNINKDKNNNLIFAPVDYVLMRFYKHFTDGHIQYRRHVYKAENASPKIIRQLSIKMRWQEEWLFCEVSDDILFSLRWLGKSKAEQR